MSDPDAQTDEAAPPPQPPRKPTVPTSTEKSQLAADEQYARQLAEHYNTSATYGAPRNDLRGRSNPSMSGPQRAGSRQYLESEDERERSFIDDDLPVIRDNIRKGFLETQAKVNSWVTNFKKKIDGEDDDEFPPPRKSSRPLANPDLFKPTPARPSSNSGRRVSFQDGPPEEIGIQQRPTSPPDLTKKPLSSTGAKSSKWQPLASLDPDPVADHDPFSLGDSDDDEIRKKDVKPEDDRRSNQLSAKPVTENVGPLAARRSEGAEQADGLDARNEGPDQPTEKSTI
ncbi:MAG: hypothetical protein Q9168_000669 [Polycauliona sp. 1 TL-2023]